jgi:orotate phosphoribosyltransferase
MDAVKYYGGNVVGLASIYSAVDQCNGVPVYSAFDANDLEGYYCVPPHECPLCKKGENVDGVVNSYGFSRG